MDNLLAETPAIWLGEEPFTTHADLAANIAAKKKLSDAVADLEQLRAAGSDDELDRLHAGIVRFRDQGLVTAERLLASRPGAVLAHLKALAKDLGGGETGAPVTKQLPELDGSDALKRAIKIAKGLDKIEKRLAKLKPCKTCKRSGLKQASTSCPTCRDDNGKALASAAKKIDALLAAADGLPVHARAEALLATLR